MSTASDLFAKSRAALLVGAPFWGVLSLRLAPVEDTSIRTMQTDGVTIRYNPDFVATLSRGALRTMIAHETMHCAALHHTRREWRDLRRWNIACDHAINPLLAAADFEIPEGLLLDPAYAGMSAEQIYDRLPQDAGDDGSDDPGGMGGVTDPPPGGDDPGQPGPGAPSAADLARQEETWSIAAAQAEATAKAMGIGAADTARVLREQVAPRLDWREVLRRYLSAAAKSDYAWTPPNRRHIASGLYLPSLCWRRSKSAHRRWSIGAGGGIWVLTGPVPGRFGHVTRAIGPPGSWQQSDVEGCAQAPPALGWARGRRRRGKRGARTGDGSARRRPVVAATGRFRT